MTITRKKVSLWPLSWVQKVGYYAPSPLCLLPLASRGALTAQVLCKIRKEFTKAALENKVKDSNVGQSANSTLRSQEKKLTREVLVSNKGQRTDLNPSKGRVQIFVLDGPSKVTEYGHQSDRGKRCVQN